MKRKFDYDNWINLSTILFLNEFYHHFRYHIIMHMKRLTSWRHVCTLRCDSRSPIGWRLHEQSWRSRCLNMAMFVDLCVCKLGVGEGIHWGLWKLYWPLPRNTLVSIFHVHILFICVCTRLREWMIACMYASSTDLESVRDLQILL